MIITLWFYHSSVFDWNLNQKSSKGIRNSGISLQMKMNKHRKITSIKNCSVVVFLGRCLTKSVSLLSCPQTLCGQLNSFVESLQIWRKNLIHSQWRSVWAYNFGKCCRKYISKIEKMGVSIIHVQMKSLYAIKLWPPFDQHLAKETLGCPRIGVFKKIGWPS